MVIRCCKTCLNRIEVKITDDDIGDKDVYVWNRYLQQCKANHGLISNLDMDFETPTECKDYQQPGFYDDAHRCRYA